MRRAGPLRLIRDLVAVHEGIPENDPTAGKMAVEINLVRAGQVLASLGNSGNSDAPHLHFHICDRPSPPACEGAPYVLDTFDLLGYAPSLSILTSERGWPATNDFAKTRRREMPRQNAVVRFRDSTLP